MIRSIATLGILLLLGGCDSPTSNTPEQETSAPTAQPSKSAAEVPNSALMFPAINVPDMQAAEAFYIGIMGMKPTLRIGEEGDAHQEVTLNFSGEMYASEASLVLNFVASRTEPYVFDGLSRIAFRVPDLDRLVARIRAAGHRVLDEPRMIEVRGAGIKLAFVEDPNGARVELIQLMLPGQGSEAMP
jgi:catechol 2,3-dioxygenase-like lactoylglutathione lyase family enzyme